MDHGSYDCTNDLEWMDCGVYVVITGKKVLEYVEDLFFWYHFAVIMIVGIGLCLLSPWFSYSLFLHAYCPPFDTTFYSGVFYRGFVIRNGESPFKRRTVAIGWS